MKYLFTICCTCLLITSFGKNATFQKLNEINKCWSLQKDLQRDKLPEFNSANEKQWIALHLSLVEKTLRARNTTHLSPATRRNREMCLGYLHHYWQQGQFPLNEDLTYRTPVFIDKHDNFCAVGYLIKASGHEAISRAIAAHSNLAYVHDMNYPALAAWAKENGFTTDELAWIQPTYPSTAHSKPIGNGVDGEVKELYADTTNGRLYVAGAFANADSTVVANNIAYITQSGSGYTWHSMGNGVNGPVNAVMGYNSLVFAGGSFTLAGGSAVSNAAYWDGTVWHAAGCLSGTVNTFIVLHDTLYAAGAFSVCPAPAAVNFAWWDGSAWLPIAGVAGSVNKLQVLDSSLVLGGAFSYGADTVNIIKWNAGAGFSPFTNSLSNEVKDMQVYHDTMYAVCKHTSPVDSTNLFIKLSGSAWVPAFSSYGGTFSAGPGCMSFNTLCAESNTLNTGGQFLFTPSLGSYAQNCFSIGVAQSILVDSAVNKMIIFNSDLFVAGKFKTGFNETNYGTTNIPLNGIAKRDFTWLSVPVSNTAELSIYPNPVAATSQLTITNDFHAAHFAIRDVTSRELEAGALHGEKCEIPLAGLSSGLYIIEVSNNNGTSVIRKFTVL